MSPFNAGGRRECWPQRGNSLNSNATHISWPILSSILRTMITIELLRYLSFAAPITKSSSQCIVPSQTCKAVDEATQLYLTSKASKKGGPPNTGACKHLPQEGTPRRSSSSGSAGNPSSQPGNILTRMQHWGQPKGSSCSSSECS